MKWLIKDPSFGDMIRVEVCGLYHVGIYVSDDEVIQFGLPPVSRQHLRDDEVEVLSSHIDDFLAGGFLEVCEFDKKEKKQKFASRPRFYAFVLQGCCDILLLLRRCRICKNCRLVHADVHIVCNLKNNNIVINFLDFAINATACHNLLTGLQTFAEVIDLFLTLTLGANHHKVNDCNHCNNHKLLVAKNHLHPII